MSDVADQVKSNGRTNGQALPRDRTEIRRILGAAEHDMELCDRIIEELQPDPSRTNSEDEFYLVGVKHAPATKAMLTKLARHWNVPKAWALHMALQAAYESEQIHRPETKADRIQRVRERITQQRAG